MHHNFNIFIAVCFISALCVFHNAQARQFSLPATLENSFDHACLSEDVFLINAVRNAAISQYPSVKRGIQEYWTIGCEAKKLAKKAPKKEDEKQRNWKASIDAGLAFSTGNTQQENANIKANIDHETKRWKNSIKLSALTQKENELRTAEEYRASLNSRYKWRPKDYFFGEAQYVNDRFSGYSFRISESVGYGRVFLKDDVKTLEAEGSLGALHTKLTTDGSDTEHSFLQKITGRYKHKFSDTVTFSQQASVLFTDETRITESDTTLRTDLTKSLYLKLSFNYEHISDVPQGTKNTDTLTTLNLGYQF